MRMMACCGVMALLVYGCTAPAPAPPLPAVPPPLHYGAEVLLRDSLPALRGRRLGVLAHAASRVHDRAHLVDTLLALGLNVTRVFSPEHGFRGTQEAGETVASGRDARTGVTIASLYAGQPEPTPHDLAAVDLILVDIQDVGTRPYTYLTTLSYVLQAAARAGVPVWVLDRPNPLGRWADGPMLQPGWVSSVGRFPLPLMHGLTPGEFALMAKWEGWLPHAHRLQLTVIPVQGWAGEPWDSLTRPWHPPSPNLPTVAAVHCYPVLVWYEGTRASVGRGTEKPFQLTGWPGLAPAPLHPYTAAGALHAVPVPFTPRSMPGRAATPPWQDSLCTGWQLQGRAPNPEALMKLGLAMLTEQLRQWQAAHPQVPFFNPVPGSPFFEKLTGGPALRQALQAGTPPDSIYARWQPALQDYLHRRQRYLLYGATVRPL